VLKASLFKAHLFIELQVTWFSTKPLRHDVMIQMSHSWSKKQKIARYDIFPRKQNVRNPTTKRLGIIVITQLYTIIYYIILYYIYSDFGVIYGLGFTTLTYINIH